MYARSEPPQHKRRLAARRGNLASPPGLDHRLGDSAYLKWHGALAVVAIVAHTTLIYGQISVSATNILFNNVDREVVLPYNDPREIKKELLTPEILLTLGASCGLSSNEIATLTVSTIENSNGVRLMCSSNSKRPLTILPEELSSYFRERMNGHTKDFLLLASTNRLEPSQASDSDLRLLLENCSVPGAKLLRKISSHSWTNKAGTEQGVAIIGTETNGRAYLTTVTNVFRADEVVKSVVFLLVDGDVSWLYNITIGPRNRMVNLRVTRCDSKEYDPTYSKQIEEVDREARAEIHRPIVSPAVGAQLERLKKSKLKARGIDWRMSTELNPHGSFEVNPNGKGGDTYY
jgi:hypothetical protein